MGLVQTRTRKIETKKAEFHFELLSTLLTGFSIPNTTFKFLENILKSISKGIQVGSLKGDDTQQHFIVLNRYEIDPIDGTVEACKFYCPKGRVLSLIRLR